MKSREKIGIIGHFGADKSFLDGQTVKTKVLYNELKNRDCFDIITVDTYYLKKNPFKLLFQTIMCLISCKKIMVLLSRRGMRVYFPLLYYWNKLFKTKVYHDVIGGNLAFYVEKYPKYKKYLSSFECNMVELESMAKELSELGVKNAVRFPNFKRLNKVDTVMPFEGDVFRFCTFSRVMKEKGIEDAISSIEEINKRYKKTVCTLDIYGVQDEAYKQRFGKIINESSDAIKYKGCVDFDKSVETIKDYYALLFPTYWQGEGFAGTFIDAFASATVTIATDWNLNSDIVTNMKNGIIYPNDLHKSLTEAILWAINNREKMYEMKIDALKEAQEYDADVMIDKIINMLNKS